MKRVSSVLAIALGFIGTVLCIALILALWVFSSRINQSIAAFITPVEAFISSVDAQVVTLDGRVQTLQNDVIADLLVKTNAIKTAPPDVEIDTTPIFEGIEGKLEPTLRYLQSELSAFEPQIQSTIEILRLIKIFLPQNTQSVIEANISEQVTSATANLAVIQKNLQAQKSELSSITVSTDIRRIETLEAPIQELSTHLSNVESVLQRLDTVLEDVQAFIMDIKGRIRLYSILTSLAITLLSLWALWANVALFKNGRRSLRSNL